MGFTQQIYCNSCSAIAPGAASSKQAAEKTAIQYGWKVLLSQNGAARHSCKGCWEKNKINCHIDNG